MVISSRGVVAALTANGVGTTCGADDNQAQAGHLIAHALTAHHGRNDLNEDNLIAHTLTGEGFDASEDGTGRGTPLVPIAFGHWDSTVAAHEGRNSTLRRGGGGGGVADSTGVRRLTPTECERLLGFPDDWTAGQSDSTRYRQLGNAVAVPVFTWVARRIAAVDAGDPL